MERTNGKLLRVIGALRRAAFAAGSAGWDADTHFPEMSRRLRGLAACCARKAFGRLEYRAVVERCVNHAAAFAYRVEATPGIALINQASLNIVCFRTVHGGVDDAAADRLNPAAVDAIQRDGRVFVTGTVWHGRAAIRAAFDNWQTTPADLALLQAAVAEIAATTA